MNLISRYLKADQSPFIEKEAIFPLIRKSRLLAFLSQMHLASEKNVLATDAKSLIKVIPLFDRRHNFNGQN